MSGKSKSGGEPHARAVWGARPFCGKKESDLTLSFRNPFKSPEEKKRVFRIIRAKRKLEELRRKKGEGATGPEDAETSESSVEASELLPVGGSQRPAAAAAAPSRVSDESLAVGDFEEASESSESPGGASPARGGEELGERSEASGSDSSVAAEEDERSELAVEVGKARLDAIRAAERRDERERREPSRGAHAHYAPSYVARKAEQR